MMELDFDKEINALLRQAARSGDFVSTNTENHLDADEISAFAENALPEKTRSVYIKHFADCDRCRTILSNTIVLNQEADIVAASSFVITETPKIVAAKIPWYRKMFLMPNLAYTMGGLVLIFGGMLGFLVLQNLNRTASSDVSQIQEEKARTTGPSSSGESYAYNTNSSSAMSNMAAANTTANAANTSSNAALSGASSSPQTFDTNASNSSALPKSAEPSAPTINAPAAKPNQELAKRSSDNAFAIDGASADNEARKEEKLDTRNKVLGESSRDDQTAYSSGAQPANPPPPPPPPAVTQRSIESMPAPSARSKKLEDRKASESENRRQIGGKTFNRVGGVWIDSTYNPYDGAATNAGLPSTFTIRRGSDEYKKLDKQVRIIAESLPGPVIIVWKGVAFRIQ